MIYESISLLYIRTGFYVDVHKRLKKVKTTEVKK